MRLPYPIPTSESASRVMRANRGAGTRPEVRLRSAMHRAGIRFRKTRAVDAGGLRVRPDAVFPRERVAVFVDGCFWHSCPQHATTPRANTDYWLPKLRHNVERDRLVDEALVAADWTVVRVWEHEDPVSTAARITEDILRRRSP